MNRTAKRRKRHRGRTPEAVCCFCADTLIVEKLDRTVGLYWRQADLAQNAQQAMPGGGVLELQTRRQGDRVILDVIDTGQGMDQKTQAKMFDAFYSTKSNGSGLGLPTVRRVVEAHGGTIGCASEVGRGTQFTISLPASEGS